MTPNAVIRRLQRAQVSVQALSRLSSVGVFLVASWSGHSNLTLVAIQGTLFAVPYALQEALFGRVMARNVVPAGLNWTAWTVRGTLTMSLLATPIVFAVPAIAAPAAGWPQWTMAAIPVLLQMPVEGLYWLLGKRHSSACGNRVPQVVAVGTIAGAVVLATLGHSVLPAAVPSQVLVLVWATGHLRRNGEPGRGVPGLWAALRPGLSYVLIAVVSLAFAVAVPTLASAFVGEDAVVIIRALDLSFGPFHLLLSSSVREDMMRGKSTPITTAGKMLTIAAMVSTAAILLCGNNIRHLISAELAATSRSTIVAFCAYKTLFMINTWQSLRHMLRSSPSRFMTSGIVSSCIALSTVSLVGQWAHSLEYYLSGLCGSELVLIFWLALRNATDRKRPYHPSRPRQPALSKVGRHRHNRNETMMASRDNRIWINGRWTSQRITGTQRYASEILRAINESDAASCVVALPADADPPAWLTERFACVRSRYAGLLFEQVWLPLRARNRMLISLSGPAPMGKRRQLVVMHDAAVYRVPDAFSLLFRTWYRLLYALISRTDAQLVTVSMFSATELARELGIPADRFDVLPCGAEHMDAIDPDSRIADRLPIKPFAMTVGSRASHKRTSLVVDQFTRSGAHLVVVGAAPSARVLRLDMSEVAKNQAPNIYYLGWVSDEELAYLYRRADALLMPSAYEGFGIPVVEAQRLGCPVICAANASLPEVAGENAIIVSDESSQSYAAEFDRLVADSSLIKEVTERGMQNAQRYSWRSSARQLIALARAA